MRLALYFTVAAQTVQGIYPTISCFSCHAHTVSECIANGSVKQCRENQEVCQVHTRKRGGELKQVWNKIRYV